MGWFKDKLRSHSSAVEKKQQKQAATADQQKTIQLLQQQQQQQQDQPSTAPSQQSSKVQQFQAQVSQPSAQLNQQQQQQLQVQTLQQQQPPPPGSIASPQSLRGTLSEKPTIVSASPTAELDCGSLEGASYIQMPARSTIRQTVATALGSSSLASSPEKFMSVPPTPTGIVMETRGRLDTRDDEVLTVADRPLMKNGREYDVEDFSKSFSRDDEYAEPELKEEIRSTHLNSLFNGHLMKWKFEAEEGSAFIRIPAFFGSLGLITTAVVALVMEPDAWTSHSIVMSICVITMAVFVLILDGRFLSTNPLSARAHLRNIMTRNFNIFRFLWGRGLLYFVAGTLNVAQLWLMTLISGGIMMLIGSIALLVGIYSSRKFASLRNSLADESFLLLVFSNYDTDGDGYLIPHEFALLLADLGMELDDRYTLKAFNVIDTDNDRRISFEEFSHWWSSGYIERGRRRRDDETDDGSYRRLD